VKSSKYVADNIAAGNSAEVIFENAVDVALVRGNFDRRIGDWLRQVGCDPVFKCEPTEFGARYRLST
jgi:hypothetical protein